MPGDPAPQTLWSQTGGQHLLYEVEAGRIIATVRQESSGVWLANYERGGEKGYVSVQKAMAAMEAMFKADFEAAREQALKQQAKKGSKRGKKSEGAVPES